MTIKFYTLGCKVNQYDTMALSELFKKRGYTIVNKCDTPDVMVINSCTVTAESDRKTRQAVNRFRKNYPNAIIVVTGCMTQAVKEKGEKLENADVVIGNSLNEQLPDLVDEYVNTKRRIIRWKEHSENDNISLLCTEDFEERTRAFVKIQEGCNNFCTYCIVPYARGRVRSKPLKVIKEELTSLAQSGYKEIVLTGINLSAYKDNESDLCAVVEMVQYIDGIERVRLGSIEPDRIDKRDLLRLKNCSKFCPQFHLSLQSGSNNVLKKMGRRYDMALFNTLVDDIYETFENPSVTTDIMVGFPTETDEDFEDTLNAVKRCKFAKVHAFIYSMREDTPAAKMEQIGPKIKEARMNALLNVAEKERIKFFNTQKGKNATVLFERKDRDGMWEGYTENYTPVKMKCEGDLSGKTVSVDVLAINPEYCLCQPL